MPIYIAFVESDILSVPHMEPLVAETLPDACGEARELLARHASGIAVHVFDGDDRVYSHRPGQTDGSDPDLA